MNHLKLFFAVFCSFFIFVSGAIAEKKYDYPLEDAYAATIIHVSSEFRKKLLLVCDKDIKEVKK